MIPNPRYQKREEEPVNYPNIQPLEVPQNKDEYTYKSYYYGRKGYCYLPSVKRPKPHRLRKPPLVNVFKQAEKRFPRHRRY